MSYPYAATPQQYTYGKVYEAPSPYSSGEYVSYKPQYGNISSRKHVRKASHNPSPRIASWYADNPIYEANIQYATPRKEVYVSTEKVRVSRQASYAIPSTRYARTSHSRKHSQPIHIYDDEAEEATPIYIYREPETEAKHAKKQSTDASYYYQERSYEETPKRSRARRHSTASTKSPSKTPKSSPNANVPQATEADAARAGIPAGYSIKNWDPSELPLILLGSVFDANSLGKWIYDWTVFHHGASSPMADVAGDLWLLLIKLAGKMKRADECLDRIRTTDNLDMVQDFLDSGARLWEKFKTLLKDCEYYMMKAARKEGTKKMGKNAGVEFVDSIFGRDRYLESTEKLMSNVRLWNMRFDANCESILRRPSAA